MEQNNKNNKEIDLSDALNNPNKNVEIQNDEQQQSTQDFFPGTPKIIQWVIKYSSGLIKNEKQANYVLIGFMIIAIIISLTLVFSGNEKEEFFTPEAEAPIEELTLPAEF